MASEQTTFLSESERTTLAAIAAAALPRGRRLSGATSVTVAEAESFVASLGPSVQSAYRGSIAALRALSIATTGHRFESLPVGRQWGVLDGWGRHDATRHALRGLLAPLKLAYFAGDRIRPTASTGATALPSRWQSQVIAGETLSPDETVECDVVVVGTGAGGAVMAKELAELGFAVVLLEEGQYFQRSDFTGRPIEMMRRLYRRGGATGSVGNAVIPIPTGRSVGGTTTINSGTCFRAPETTFAEWQHKLGLKELTPEAMDPHYRRVEAMLGVEDGKMEHIGGAGRIIARGCDALGLSHHPLPRNAPDCDGQGLCCFGCPTDAKRSTNVSYVPAALERSAQLITGIKVEKVLTEGDRAVGVEATAAGKRITVRAQVVVLACGTLHTPVLLLRNGLANSSGRLGHNLSIHPATFAVGVFDEVVDSKSAIPQGYSVDSLKAQGILFEGGSVPIEIAAATMSGFGPGFIELFDGFDHLLQFGFMVKDTSRGRVRVGPDGEPFITYWVNDEDNRRLRLGMSTLAEIFFAAGARAVHTPVFGFEHLRHRSDVQRLASASIAPRHYDLSAYHPLGTCAMGHDPLTSVIDPTHETHDVHNLFITDGSSVPGSLGVNPQVTIMAMATRAAGFVARRLERLQRAA
jgi:choline dehydrogenase-like flavoprotein